MEKFLQVDPNDETKTIEVTVFKSFGTEEDYNKAIQSASSKAKGDLLKEMGVSSVQDVKDKFGKIAEFEEKATKYTELEGSYNELKSKYDKVIDELLVTKYGVADDFKNEFLTVAKAGVTDKITLEQSAQSFAEKLSKMTGGTIKVKIGGGKTPTLTEEEKKTAQMRAAFGLK